MASFRYTTLVDGGNDVQSIDVIFEAADTTAAWAWSDKMMDQIGIKRIDRVNPWIKPVKPKG